MFVAYRGGTMQINVAPALKMQGTPLEFKFSITSSELELKKLPFEINSEISIKGDCVYTGENFIVKGLIVTDYTSRCDRCTKPVTGRLELSFMEEYASHEDENHPDRYLYKGDDIIIDKMVKDNIYLGAPIQYLCSNDCRGLCPQCGADLNKTDCGCRVEQMDDEVNNPFAVLKDMLRDDEEEV